RGEVVWRRWFVVPVLVLALLGLACLRRAATAETLVSAGGSPTPGAPAANLRHYCLASAAACAAGVGLWLLAFRAPGGVAPGVLGALMVAALAWLGYGYALTPQSGPALFSPRLPALAQVARAPPGRVLGLDCLPSQLPQAYGLRDVRGYDAVDP